MVLSKRTLLPLPPENGGMCEEERGKVGVGERGKCRCQVTLVRNESVGEVEGVLASLLGGCCGRERTRYRVSWNLGPEPEIMREVSTLSLFRKRKKADILGI